ncbi:MAG: helix-turn-helix domain-containing protein [Bacteroides sp.]|nr:helix-turn-helix domain-containing protein [Bacteroides sp.]
MKNDNIPICTFEDVKTNSPEAVSLGDGLLYINQSKIVIHNKLRLTDNLFIACFIRSGEGIIIINEKHIEVRASDLVIVQLEDIFQPLTVSDDFNSVIFICTRQQLIELIRHVDIWYFLKDLRNSSRITITDRHWNFIEFYLDLIERKLAEAVTVSQLTIDTCTYFLSALVNEIYEYFIEIKDGISPVCLQQTKTIYKEFITLLSTTSFHHRNIEWYTDKLYVTAKYLSNICRKYSGHPASEVIKDYVKADIRIQLKNSNLSIKEITAYLGYPSATFFGKCVKRWFNMTPRQLREKLRNETK